MALTIDGPDTADWTKRTWDLPPYKSDEFMGLLRGIGMTLEEFRKLPVYKYAVERGLIKDDEWVGKSEEPRRLR